MMENFYLIKKDISNLKSKSNLIKFISLTAVNSYINYKLDIPFYNLYLLPSYYIGKLAVFYKIREHLDLKLKTNFDKKLKVFNFKFENFNKFEIIFKSDIPFPEINKDRLEHSLNATITKMEPAKNKRLFLASFSKGKVYDFTKLEKGSLERLEAILRYLKGKPKYINYSENEVEKLMQFTSIINPKKIIRELPNIEHKFGLKKGYLNVEHDEGIYSFKIKKDVDKTYVLDDIIGKTKKPSNMQLPFILGVNYSTGSTVVKDLMEILHLLVAGKTGSGKSVTFKCIIESLMYWNQNVAFYMLDFAESALIRYSKFRNVKYVESDFESIKNAVNELREEMRDRMQKFRNNNIENIKEYNKLCTDIKIPYLIFAIDEANGFKEDLSKKEFEELLNQIKALLKRGRKYGIIVLFAVQQTNDTDFVKSWRTQTTRLGHLLVDHVDCANLTTNKEIASKLPNLGKGEFYLVQEGIENCPKLKGCLSDKINNQLYEILKEVYCEKIIEIDKKEISTEKSENAAEIEENATNKNTFIS